MFPLAFVAGWLQGHWWGFISRNYVVWPIFIFTNVFIALKGSHFWFLFKYISVSNCLKKLCILLHQLAFLAQQQPMCHTWLSFTSTMSLQFWRKAVSKKRCLNIKSFSTDSLIKSFNFIQYLLYFSLSWTRLVKRIQASKWDSDMSRRLWYNGETLGRLLRRLQKIYKK